jgi:PAS domain S-box-containing protein
LAGVERNAAPLSLILKKSLRALFIEDRDDDAQLILHELQKGGYDVEWQRVETKETVQAALEQRSWDIIICDYSLPKFTAPEALLLLKASGQDLPFIIVSGTIDEESAVTALRAGAHDFVSKAKLARLLPAVARELKDADTRHEHKRTEAAFRESEYRFSRLFNVSPDAILVIDPHDANISWPIVNCNEAACQMNGYTREELIGQPVDILNLGGWNLEEKNAYLDNLRSEAVVKLETLHRHKDGHIFPIETSTSVFTLDGRELILGIDRDITERKQAEEALRQSDVRFRSLFENTPVSIWEEDFSELKIYLDNLMNTKTTDLEKYLEEHPEEITKCIGLVKILDVNQASLKLFGVETKEQLLHTLITTFEAEAMNSFKQELVAITKGLYQLEMDVVLKTIDGQRRDATLGWAVVPGYEKTFSRVLISLVDITERKQHERELEALAAVSMTLRQAATLDEMLPRLLDRTLELVKAEIGSIWLYDIAVDQVNLAVQRGWATEPSITSFRIGEGIPGWVVKNGEAIVTSDFSTHPSVLKKKRSAIPKGFGGAGIPLYSDKNVVGALFINVKLPRKISGGELRVLNALAEIGGSAIYRMYLLERTLKQLEHLRSLRTIDIAISSNLNLKMSLKTVLKEVSRQLKVDAASILLINPDTNRLEFSAGQGFRTHNINSTDLSLGEGYAGQVALDKKIVYIKDLSQPGQDFTRSKLLKNEEFTSYFGVPLISKDKVQGVLEIFNRSPLHVEKEWLNFLNMLGGQASIAVENALLFENLQKSNSDLESAYNATIEGWSHALDLRDKETEGHSQRVTELALKLSRSFGMDEDMLVNVKRGSLLHDIGKMGVPDSVLLKPGPLTEDEWRIMRQHPQFAYELLAPISYLQQALDIPYCHHEKWDGTGYPRGLKGEEIPLTARIFAIGDVWDALTNERPYRPAWSDSKALEYIRENSGTHFDPQVVELFLKNITDSKSESFSK